jgi:serine/threonine protein kinase
MIKNNNIVKLIDFGCCVKLTEEEPKRLSTCGTHLYMSPELINLIPYDYCVDIWALGVLLFELLEGFSPFGKRDDDYNEIYSNILTKKFKVNKELSNNCLDLLNKMLENNCDKRININGVFNHPWIKDWSIDNKNIGNLNVENFNNKNNDDDGDYFNNILNQVKKKIRKEVKKIQRKKIKLQKMLNMKRKKII